MTTEIGHLLPAVVELQERVRGWQGRTPRPASAKPRPDPEPSKRPRFRGVRGPHYTMVPDEILDEELPRLTGAELKCLLYIVRKTFGWKKDSDAISLSQMVSGTKTRNGDSRDGGVGLSKSVVAQALASLEADGYIERRRHQSPEHGHEPTVYSLRMADDP